MSASTSGRIETHALHSKPAVAQFKKDAGTAKRIAQRFMMPQWDIEPVADGIKSIGWQLHGRPGPFQRTIEGYARILQAKGLTAAIPDRSVKGGVMRHKAVSPLHKVGNGRPQLRIGRLIAEVTPGQTVYMREENAGGRRTDEMHKASGKAPIFNAHQTNGAGRERLPATGLEIYGTKDTHGIPHSSAAAGYFASAMQAEAAPSFRRSAI